MPIPEGLDANSSRTTPPKRNRNAKKTKGGGGASIVVRNGAKSAKGKKRLSGVLNPPFDSRMRGVGGPLNRSRKIKRGWIQSGPYEEQRNRVNFLFNPSQVDASSSIDPSAPSPIQTRQNPADPTRRYAVGNVSTVALSLLYDRTYEMFSTGSDSMRKVANQYGVYADVLAWYYFLKMIDEIPAAPVYERVGGKLIFSTDWAKTTFTAPMHMVSSYLYVGPRMSFYGFVSSINVTYSHFSQHMIPVRCKVDIGFNVLPDLPTRGMTARGTKKKASPGAIKQGGGWNDVGSSADWNGADLFNDPHLGSSGIGTPGTIIGPGGQVIGR